MSELETLLEKLEATENQLDDENTQMDLSGNKKSDLDDLPGLRIKRLNESRLSLLSTMIQLLVIEQIEKTKP